MRAIKPRPIGETTNQPTNKKGKTMINTTQTALVDVQPATVGKYVEAHEEIQRRLGKSPGPEFLMALAVEKEDPMDLINSYCGIIIQELQENR